LEFLKDQYRHCKTILVQGSAVTLLDKVGIRPEADAGLILADSAVDPKVFITALAKHRHTERDQDPPLL
jgi:catalase